MRTHQRRTVHRSAAILAALATLLACGGGDDDGGVTGPPPPPVQRTLDVTVTLTSFQVIQDCDDRGFPATLFDDDTHGEFQYRFWVAWPDGSTPTIADSESYTDQVRRGETGTVWTHGQTSRRVLDGPGPHTIRVRLTATEWDKELVGGWFEDEWLDHESVEAPYTVRTGDVSGGNRTGSFLMGNEGDNYSKCYFRANFTVSTVEGVK
jgi:hypothetical protein